mgnify:CR=1 FL=1
MVRNSLHQTLFTIVVFFTDPNHNPFKLTNKTQKQALDYEENLCYCYDCDLEQSKGFQFLENLLDSQGNQPFNLSPTFVKEQGHI